MLQCREALQGLEAELEEVVSAEPVLERVAAVVGKTTGVVLLASLGSPQGYPDAASYLKAFGLNPSSGRLPDPGVVMRHPPG